MTSSVPLKTNDMVAIVDVKDVILLWLDPSVDKDEYSMTRAKLATVYNNFKKCSTMADGENTIEQCSENNGIILIISGRFGKELIPRIHQLKRVLAIYIFCMDQKKYAEWAKCYDKVVAVVVDSNKLVSMIECDYERRLTEKRAELTAVPNIHMNSGKNNAKMPATSNNDSFRYSVKDLINAGELQYMEKTTEGIVKDIVSKFENESQIDLHAFINESIQPIMYMLKRQQNLAEFFDSMKTELCADSMDTIRISQHFVIDTILLNSSQLLCRRLMTLLSKRNPVPMIQPSVHLSNNKYRAIPYLIHIWDYDRPILLSLGIGQCKGKSSLNNALFESNFEESTEDPYFSGTVDVDFGYHFVQRRPLNIADVHGEISIESLREISMIFNGILIHVDQKYFCSNHAHIIEYLKLFPSDRYIQFIIRDVSFENDSNLKTAIEIITKSISSNYQTICLPNTSNKNSAQSKAKIKKLREYIFQNATQLQRFPETFIREHLEKLIDGNEKQMMCQDKMYINRIRNVLVRGNVDDYPLYSAYANMCRKRLELYKINPYERNFESDKLYKLNDELFQAIAELQKRQSMDHSNYGTGFTYFLDLLNNQNSRLTHLHLLSMELAREREKQTNKHHDVPFYERLSLELHWRNVIIGYEFLKDVQKQILVKAYQDYILEGNPFEILDGDNFEMQHVFLKEVFGLFSNKKIFVVSVIGPQNSGKSTLLNFLFGASFEARDGRCTKGKFMFDPFYFVDTQCILISGVYGTFINVQNRTNESKLIPLEYDYILVIDTEGLLSIQKSDEQYDKSLILFCLAVSHLVIINAEGEINEPMSRCFVLCAQSLKYLGETRVRRPTVHFVLNKRNNPNEDYCKTLIEHVRNALNTNNLNNEIDLQTENFHILSMAFNTKILTNKGDRYEALVTLSTFIDDVNKVCKRLIDDSPRIIREVGDNFCIPVNWVNFANRIFQTIKRHPDLTYFKDVFERKQYETIRDDIRKDFDEYLSPAIARTLIEREKDNESDHIKKSFEVARNNVLKILEEKLKEHCDEHEATKNIRDRSLELMKVQLINIYGSWEVSAIMKSERSKINRIEADIEKNIREKVITTTHKSSALDHQAARQMLEEYFSTLLDQSIKKSFESERMWKKYIDLVLHLCDFLQVDGLPPHSDILSYEPFLTRLDHIVDQSISISECLENICKECQARTSHVQPLTFSSSNISPTIITNDIKYNYKFLNNETLFKLFIETQGKAQTREAFRKDSRQLSMDVFHKNWEKILQLSTCSRMLIEDIKKCLNSKQSDDFSIEITFIQEILGVVNKIIQDFNNELNGFGFHLSKDFCTTLYTRAILSMVLYHYNRQKTDFLNVIKVVKENKFKVIEKYIPFVVLVDNDDENVAMNFINELSQVLLSKIFEPKVRSIIESCKDGGAIIMRRSRIIDELDGEVLNNSDEWLLQYILEPQSLIKERGEEKWIATKEATDKTLNGIAVSVSELAMQLYDIIETLNRVLQSEGGHSLSFVNELFKLKDNQTTSSPSDTKFCMAKLFYSYLVGEEVPTEITIHTRSTYMVDMRWKNLVDQRPYLTEEIKQVFCLTENIFQTATISYPGLFLDKVLGQKDLTITALSQNMNSLVKEIYSSVQEALMKQLLGCETRCPCCKRICDFDHQLEHASPVGIGNNRHQCRSGHQIRGMGGMRFELTDEASVARCEMIEDDRPITINNNRQTWAAFKNANHDWNFGDSMETNSWETRYAYIWKRIGKMLCQHFANGMRFVEKNSPAPINHFILILDHSGSMNEGKTKSLNRTPWEHLLQAVKLFLDIRHRQVSFSDKITAIVFANRAERIYHFEKLKNIDTNRLNIPMKICGGGTQYSTAFQMAIKALEEANNHPEREQLRQTIIFMTDGEPQDDSTVELQKLCDWRKGTAKNADRKALINNFWTMALGNFNRRTIQNINKNIQGKLVNIEHPEDLADAYAEAAEIL